MPQQIDVPGMGVVEFPDGMSDDQIASAIKANMPAEVNMAADVAKSAITGLARGAIGLAGLPKDISNLSDNAVDAISAPDWLKTGIKAPKYLNPIGLASAMLPSSQTIQGAIEGVTGNFYKPKTVAGEYAQTAGEFLPAVIGGPESLALKLGTRVVAPAIASETAGQLTKGTAAEPYARVAGALAGGVGASKLANTMAERSAIKAATPSLDDIKTQVSGAYDALTSRNVATPIPQSTLDTLAGDITATLNSKGVRPSVAKSIHDAVDEIRVPASAGSADVADLVAARQNIKNLLGSPDANKTGAFLALSKIERTIESASPGTMAKLKEADKNWASMKAGEALDKRMARADLRAAGENSGANVGNKIRQQVTNYLLSSEARYLPAETKRELEKIVRGTASQNTMRWAANLLGGGGGLGMLAGGYAGYQAGGVEGALAGAAAGTGLKIATNRSTIKQAERVSQGIRARSPLGMASPPLLPPMSNPILAGLMPALLANQNK